jgi:virginiamycin B lyase
MNTSAATTLFRMTQPETTQCRYLLRFIALTALAVSPIACRAEDTPVSCGLGGLVTFHEQPMEGVLISAKRNGTIITVTVVSDSHGHYEFPCNRVPAGDYHISIRAAGYDLDDPGSVAVKPGKKAEADLRLRATANLAPQLTSAEWLISLPGSQKQKSTLYRCVACHDITPIVQSHYDVQSWPKVLARMETWVPPSVLSSPVRNPSKASAAPPDPGLVDYLSSINLHGRATWPFELRTFPRPKGPAARVLVAEYDLPGPSSFPHDAVVGRDGFIWYNDFQRALVGRLDPRSGQTKEWTLPILRPGYPEGLLTIKIDRDGNAWIPRFFQGCTVTRMNTKTEQFTTWTVPAEYNGPQARCAHVALGAPDGTVWMSDSAGRRMFKLDPRTGQFRAYDSFPNYAVDRAAPTIETAGQKSRGHRTYGIGVDSKGNGYFADIAGGTIGEIDAETGKATLYPTPTPDSGPRRTYMDNQDRYWFGENYSSKVGMFDTKTKQFQEWAPPVPWSGAYPVIEDKNGDVWTVGMSTDYVYRLDPKTGTFIEYLLPTVGANLRKVDVDNSTNPVSIWVAEVHRGKIAKIEPLP